ncbi:MAG: efflux RND transporter periplasmic adaptor subunit [Allosphingosinicella sp.]
MKKFVPAVIIGLAMFSLGFGIRQLGSGADETAPAAASNPPPAQTAAGPAQGDLDVSGRVVVRRIATVSSAYTAQLKAVHVREGDFVKAGQVLAELDASEAEASRDGAASRVEQLRASERRAVAAQTLARLQLQRGEALGRTGYVTSSRLDELRAAAKSAEAEAQSVRHSRQAASSDLQSASIRQGRLVVRAPFAGVVSAVSAEVGEIVSPSSAGGGFVRTGICTLLDLDSREVEAFVPERHLATLKPGTLAEIRSEAIPGQRFRARVASIGSEIDVQKSAVKIRLALVDMDQRLLPNMSVTVRLNMNAAGAADARSPR